MTIPDKELVFWLPPWSVLKAQFAASPRLASTLQRADLHRLEAGETAQLARAFDVLPRDIAVAPLTRQLDAGDAMGFTWLRADPGSVRADMASARLLSCGAELGLSAQDSEALLRPLKPLFGDEGFPISAPVPSRWYVCLPADVRLPRFAPPEAVFGDDLLAHMPDGPQGQRWRRLMSEAQIILHNHPVNAARAKAGRLPVNTVWFWGAGRLPDHVQTGLGLAFTDDPLVQALCQRAGTTARSRTDEFPAAMAPVEAVIASDSAWDASILMRHGGVADGPVLFDLRDQTRLTALENRWLAAALDAVAKGHVNALRLDFADGLVPHWRSAHRWRFWRRRLPA